MMDKQTVEWLLENVSNPLVKVEPRARGGHCTWGRARLLRLANDDYAIIQPFGHKREEKVALEHLHKWSSRNEASMPLTESLADKFKEKETMHAKKMNGLIPQKYSNEIKAEAVRLRQSTTMTYEEIAAKLKIPTYIVTNALSKARKKTKPAPVVAVARPRPESAPPKPTLTDSNLEAIRAILKTKLPDTTKLLAIEGLVS